ncbi:MAG: hypothetical protein PHO83_04780 [Geobacteraceae bacterium]|nr:hypothetical protein [Geobacteraceae bacterium]
MQTKLVILASIFGVISALSFSTNQNILLSLFTGLIASTLFLLAYFSKDKKDKQIEEIHATVTTKTKSEVSVQIPQSITQKERRQTIPEAHDKVLELLFQKPSTVDNICKTLKLQKEEANYFLNDLWGKNQVAPPAPYSSPQEWRIDQEGREYVMMKRKG